MPATYEFELGGATFYAHKQAGAIWVPIAPLCGCMTLDIWGQQQRIARDPILAESTCVLQVPLISAQSMVCLQLRRLPYWLLGVSLGHINDADVKAKVLNFKQEAADVLFAYFMPSYAAVMGLTLPLFNVRLLQGDLFDRVEYIDRSGMDHPFGFDLELDCR